MHILSISFLKPGIISIQIKIFQHCQPPKSFPVQSEVELLTKANSVLACVTVTKFLLLRFT